MQIGWVDFSRKDRDDVLDILDKLSEKGVLDELGISQIRDGFADIFFPGTSTLQTRAKYFLLIPYICKDLEKSDNVIISENELKNREKKATQLMLNNCGPVNGLMGRDYLNKAEWILRPPSVIYWSGLRKLGILTRDESRLQYLKRIKKLKEDKITLKIGNNNDDDGDDLDANKGFNKPSFHLETYNSSWKNDLSIKLTSEEAFFLEKRIIESNKDSLFAYLLLYKKDEIKNCDTFYDLVGLVDDMELNRVCTLAMNFSDFFYTISIIYNGIIFGRENDFVKKRWEEIENELDDISNVDLDAIYGYLENKGIKINNNLKKFLNNSKDALKGRNIDKIEELIKKRESNHKGPNRAKTSHPGQYNIEEKWYCGDRLDYRFEKPVKTLIKDILDGEEDVPNA